MRPRGVLRTEPQRIVDMLDSFAGAPKLHQCVTDMGVARRSTRCNLDASLQRFDRFRNTSTHALDDGRIKVRAGFIWPLADYFTEKLFAFVEMLGPIQREAQRTDQHVIGAHAGARAPVLR